MKPELPTLLATFLGISALICPTFAHADEPDPVHRFEDDRTPPPAARGKVLLAGTLITGAFYLPVLGASYAWPDRRGAEDLRLPVVGPWMTFGQTRLCNAEPVAIPNCSNFIRVAGAVLLALDGLGQAGGVAVMLQSLFMRTGSASSDAASHDRRDFASLTTSQRPRLSRSLTFQTGDFELTPVPMLGPSSDLGLAFIGRF